MAGLNTIRSLRSSRQSPHMSTPAELLTPAMTRHSQRDTPGTVADILREICLRSPLSTDPTDAGGFVHAVLEPPLFWQGWAQLRCGARSLRRTFCAIQNGALLCLEGPGDVPSKLGHPKLILTLRDAVIRECVIDGSRSIRISSYDHSSSTYCIPETSESFDSWISTLVFQTRTTAHGGVTLAHAAERIRDFTMGLRLQAYSTTKNLKSCQSDLEHEIEILEQEVRALENESSR